MASGHSDIVENRILDKLYGGTDFAVPATWHIALFTVSPSDAGGGTEVSATGTGYVRLAVTNNAANWPAAVGGSKSNASVLTWALSTAAWGNIVAVGFFDATTAGVMWDWADIAVGDQQNINGANQRFEIAANQLVITEN